MTKLLLGTGSSEMNITLIDRDKNYEKQDTPATSVGRSLQDGPKETKDKSAAFKIATSLSTSIDEAPIKRRRPEAAREL